VEKLKLQSTSEMQHRDMESTSQMEQLEQESTLLKQEADHLSFEKSELLRDSQLTVEMLERKEREWNEREQELVQLNKEANQKLVTMAESMTELLQDTASANERASTEAQTMHQLHQQHLKERAVLEEREHEWKQREQSLVQQLAQLGSVVNQGESMAIVMHQEQEDIWRISVDEKVSLIQNFNLQKEASEKENRELEGRIKELQKEKHELLDRVTVMCEDRKTLLREKQSLEENYQLKLEHLQQAFTTAHLLWEKHKRSFEEHRGILEQQACNVRNGMKEEVALHQDAYDALQRETKEERTAHADTVMQITTEKTQLRFRLGIEKLCEVVRTRLSHMVLADCVLTWATCYWRAYNQNLRIHLRQAEEMLSMRANQIDALQEDLVTAHSSALLKDQTLIDAQAHALRTYKELECETTLQKKLSSDEITNQKQTVMDLEEKLTIAKAKSISSDENALRDKQHLEHRLAIRMKDLVLENERKLQALRHTLEDAHGIEMDSLRKRKDAEIEAERRKVSVQNQKMAAQSEDERQKLALQKMKAVLSVNAQTSKCMSTWCRRWMHANLVMQHTKLAVQKLLQAILSVNLLTSKCVSTWCARWMHTKWKSALKMATSGETGIARCKSLVAQRIRDLSAKKYAHPVLDCLLAWFTAATSSQLQTKTLEMERLKKRMKKELKKTEEAAKKQILKAVTAVSIEMEQKTDELIAERKKQQACRILKALLQQQTLQLAIQCIHNIYLGCTLKI